VEIDAKAGENYFLNDGYGRSEWHLNAGTYSPKAKDIERLRRVVIERPASVDGVVQSWDEKHILLVLAVPGSIQVREFTCPFTLGAGMKVRAFYSPSRPKEVVDLNSIQ